MSAPVDVLAVMESAYYALPDHRGDVSEEIFRARQAVAELIDAGKELVDAQADYDAIDFPSGRRLDRLSAARERHAAALARVQGGAK